MPFHVCETFQDNYWQEVDWEYVEIVLANHPNFFSTDKKAILISKLYLMENITYLAFLSWIDIKLKDARAIWVKVFR